MGKLKKATIYTRAGDRGETTLFGGKKVSKNNLRIEAYGTIDELNSSLGAASALIRDKKISLALTNIQNELFNIGAELATERKAKLQFKLGKVKIEELEKLIDFYDKNLRPLKTFILPKGSFAASLIHSARTICRRAERRIVALSEKEKINENLIGYINRLGDFLFCLARYLNKKARSPELEWSKEK